MFDILSAKNDNHSIRAKVDSPLQDSFQDEDKLNSPNQFSLLEDEPTATSSLGPSTSKACCVDGSITMEPQCLHSAAPSRPLIIDDLGDAIEMRKISDVSITDSVTPIDH